MRLLSLSLLSVALLTPFLSAQANGAGPGRYRIANPPPPPGSPYFEMSKYLTSQASTPTKPTLDGITQPSPIWIPGATSRNVVQVHTTKAGLSGLKAGQWGMALTIYSLHTYYGGGTSSRQAVIYGKYDVSGSSLVFTPNKMANLMNSPGGFTFGLMVEDRDGLYATVDWQTPPGPMISWRPNKTSAWPVPILILDQSGLPPKLWSDPAPAYVEGVLYIFMTNGTDIVMRQVTKQTWSTTTPKVLTAVTVGPEIPVVQIAGQISHSPTPIPDKNGNCQGLWCSSGVGQDMDMHFVSGLTLKDTPFKVYEDGYWMNNGGVIGGTLLFADNAQYDTIHEGKAAWMVGSRTKLNLTPPLSMATITVGAPGGSITPLVSTNIGLALDLTLIPGIQIPGIQGGYALGALPLVFAGTVSIDKDETGYWSSLVPASKSLIGFRLPIQGLSGPVGLPPAWTSTAHLEFH